jgi:hypothetical protein
MNEEKHAALLDWVEKAALENIKAQMQSADELKREANIALNVFLAGATASAAYSAKALSDGLFAFGCAALLFASVLYVLCALDLYYCLWISDFPAPTNEPKRLLVKDEDFESLRVAELNQMQIRIEKAQARNSVRAASLNFLRGAALLSPLIPGLALIFLR